MKVKVKLTPKGRKSRATRQDIHASIVLGKTRRAQKTADEAAWKQNVRQKRSKVQTAWQDVISKAKMIPERLKKEGFQQPKKRAYVSAL